MNFGYAYPIGQRSSFNLKPEDQADAYSWQIYEHMLRVHPPTPDSTVLEVGSGRGGACYLISQYYHPHSVTGIDLSDQAITFCTNTYHSLNLKYIVASAEKLPIQDGSVDLVINAESSHAYPDFNQFIREVHRVLKPGGYFMTADNRKAELVADWKNALLISGLILEKEQDITDQVIGSLNEQENTKTELISRNVPSYFKKYFKEFAGMKGSRMYEDFTHRRRYYKSFILQKSV